MRRVAILLLGLLTACSGAWKRMRPAAEIAGIAQLVEANAALPERTGKVVVERIGETPVRMAWRETHAAGSGPLVVLLHGLLSDRTNWDFVAGELGRDHDLLAFDLVGCGESDLPRPCDLGEQGYGPTAQARRVLAALRVRLREHPAGRRLALVGHSYGGMVCLRMFGAAELRAEFGEVLDRIDHVVLLASVDFAVEKIAPGYERLATLPLWKVRLAQLFGMYRGIVAETTLAGTQVPELMPREVVATAAETMSRPGSLRAMREMIRLAVPFAENGRPDWDAIERLVAEYRHVRPPVLILWGARDESWPTSMGYKLVAQLPDAYLSVLEKRMHYLPSIAPRTCAVAIRDFVARGPAGRPRITHARAIHPPPTPPVK